MRDAFRALGRTIHQYALLMRLHKPIGIWLLLWPALWGLWIAGAGRPDPKLLILFVVGVVVTRSAGCVINDYADRDFDPQVARTRDRPLAAGRVSPAEALLLFAALGLVAVWLALQLDPVRAALRGRGRSARRHLSLAQAHRARAAVLPRRRLRLVHPDGVRGADGGGAENRVAPPDRRRALGRGLRHDVCDGGPRGRRAHRREVDRHPVRRGRPLHHRGHDGDDAARALARGPRRRRRTRSQARGRRQRHASRAPVRRHDRLDRMPTRNTTGIWFQLQNWIRPATVFQVAASGARHRHEARQPSPTSTCRRYESTRVFATAKDGTKIPVSVVYRKGHEARRLGADPDRRLRILRHQVGRRISGRDSSRGWNRAACGRRPMCAAAESIGREWHEGGRLLTKPNTWGDMIAAAEKLIAEKWTSCGAACDPRAGRLAASRSDAR